MLLSTALPRLSGLTKSSPATRNSALVLAIGVGHAIAARRRSWSSTGVGELEGQRIWVDRSETPLSFVEASESPLLSLQPTASSIRGQRAKISIMTMAWLILSFGVESLLEASTSWQPLGDLRVKLC